MPAGSIPLGFNRELEEQSGEEGASFEGTLGTQLSREYLHREGSRATGEAEEQGGLTAISTMSPRVARVHPHSLILWDLVEFSSGRCQCFPL